MELHLSEKPHLSTPYTKGEALLKVNISRFSYGDKLVLRDVRFIEFNALREDITTGQTLAILGRSGRGKSTLFKLIAGLEHDINAEIILNVNNEPKFVKEGMVGMIDQKYTLFRHMTVRQILEYAGKRNKSVDLTVLNSFVTEMCNQWGLTDVIDQYPHTLSGGQRQRVSILEKLFLGNHYLILDEPISGLDIVAIQKVKKNMERIVAEHDLNTLIFSTHDIGFAYEMADVIYVLGIEQDKPGSTIVSSFDRRYGSAYSQKDVEDAVIYS